MASATSRRRTPTSWRSRRAAITAWASSPTGRSWPGGTTSTGQCDVPAPNADFVAVAAGLVSQPGPEVRRDDRGLGVQRLWPVRRPCAERRLRGASPAGYRHSLGLKSDGTIVAWGYNDYGQCDVPAPNADFVAVAAGETHSLGLKSDGTIVAWGANSAGQCDVPAPNADFVAVAAGDGHSLDLQSDGHSLGLKSDGTIVAWGANSAGLCDVPDPNADFIAISAGWGHNLAIRSDTPVGVDGDNIADDPGEANPDELVPIAGIRLAIHPNPFNPHTTVSFSLDWPQQVTISVFDMTGRRVAVVADQAYSAGSHTVEWNGRDASGRAVSSGTYLVRLETEDRVEARKVMLVR